MQVVLWGVSPGPGSVSYLLLVLHHLMGERVCLVVFVQLSIWHHTEVTWWRRMWLYILWGRRKGVGRGRCSGPLWSPPSGEAFEAERIEGRTHRFELPHSPLVGAAQNSQPSSICPQLQTCLFSRTYNLEIALNMGNLSNCWLMVRSLKSMQAVGK